MDCCGTLPLVPNCTPCGKVTSGARVPLSITLFQYCHPSVNWFTRVGEKEEFRVTLATCRWLTVKLTSVRSKLPLLWSFRLLLAWVETDRYALCLLLIVQSMRPLMRFSKNGVGTVADGCAPSEVTSLSSVSAVGSSASAVCSRSRSMAKKANSFSFLIGPPIEPPNHWREYGGVE